MKLHNRIALAGGSSSQESKPVPQSDTINRRVVLAARPRGLPTAREFRLDQV